MSVYTVFKNHLHNTLEITKEDIRKMVEASVEKIVERKIDTIFPDKVSLENHVKWIIKGKGDNWWYESEDNFDDWVKREVVRELLRGVKLGVEVKRSKKDSIDPEMIKIGSVRKRKL